MLGQSRGSAAVAPEGEEIFFKRGLAGVAEPSHPGAMT